MRYCSIDGCNNVHKAYGHCYKHYIRLKKYGTTDKPENKHRTHGMSNEPIYALYKTMIARCHKPWSASYPNYGARGISVCERWRGSNGFINFYKDMGDRPSAKHSLDRIDNDGNYEPSNCKWSDWFEQANNRRLASNNKTGVSGVHWRNDAKKWQATITRGNKRVKLGCYTSLQGAINARRIAESQL